MFPITKTATPAETIQFDVDSLVIALMGASPETNNYCERMSPDIDFEMTRNNIGRIRIGTVEDMQNQIISMMNLQAIEEGYGWTYHKGAEEALDGRGVFG